MNKERILAVAAAIENYSIPGFGFDMRDFISSTAFEAAFMGDDSREIDQDPFGHECKTTACIAGYTLLLFAPERAGRGEAVSDIAANLLGIEHDIVAQNRLFYMIDAQRGWDDATPELAAQVLRNLAATGEVDWDI